MSKKSILLGFSIFLMIGLCATISAVKAHTPGGMNLSYNSNTEVLSVTITHNVSNNNTHYIITVVEVNGSTIISEAYTNQPTKGTFTYLYTNVTANKGATIYVKTTCNQVGFVEDTLTVGDGITTTNGENGEIPGYLGIWIIIGFSLTAVLTQVRKKIKGD